MKNIITILIMLVAFGCGKTETQRLEEENKKLETELKEEKHKLDTEGKNKKLEEDLLKRSVVGSYETKKDENGIASKYVFLETGKVETWTSADHYKRPATVETWKIVEKEVHVWEDGKEITYIIRIKPNGDLTAIAFIEDGKRTDIPKEKQFTIKRLKE